jgi:hypothetical protein
MSTYTFDLDFGGGDVEQGELPGAVAYISLKHKAEQVHISFQCVGPAELEGEVNRLKAELNEVLRLGRQRFKDYELKTKEAIFRKHEQRP